jgi:murein DD-endopeptidase MepM/ murein hydrolase activator NlpD
MTLSGGGAKVEMAGRSRRRIIGGVLGGLVLASWLLVAMPGAAADQPFRAPLDGPPGPDSWFIGQWYGNTVWAHDNAYPAGQGLHFGIDFNTLCGTPVLAIGDGVVFAVDGPYGAAPHNLVIQHANGLFSLYGHLLQRPTIAVGTEVHAGDPVALSGDPAGRCDLDPHLHLEIRTDEMRRTVNPVPLLNLDWQRATAGIRRNGTTFEPDPDNPDRWMSFADQPDVNFGGPRLNIYERGWP